MPSFESFRRQAEKRLRILESAASIRDLAHLPGNRLEALSGDRGGQYSIRINEQWRICFAWPPGTDGPENVGIVDYHEGVKSMPRTPIHPGEVLADELKEIGISAAELGRILGVPANRISQIIAGKRAISADSALRLARYFGTTPDLWMNLQQNYELDLARPQLAHALSHIPQRAVSSTSVAHRQ